nr:HAMP domain-containing sensor histidine kinase [Okeania sp. SIO2C9]
MEDNGLGVTSEERERIFEQGFTTKDVGKVTGLGMAIAHQIITDKHGGKITCNSILTKGTIFTITEKLWVCASPFKGIISGQGMARSPRHIQSTPVKKNFHEFVNPLLSRRGNYSLFIIHY